MTETPWDPYWRLRRAQFQRGNRAHHDANPIVDRAAHRTWSPGERCTPDQLDAVFMLLDDYGPLTQDELAENVADLFGLQLGTARGAVSGALFALQEMELAHWTRRYEGTDRGGRSKVWALTDESS